MCLTITKNEETITKTKKTITKNEEFYNQNEENYNQNELYHFTITKNEETGEMRDYPDFEKCKNGYFIAILVILYIAKTQ